MSECDLEMQTTECCGVSKGSFRKLFAFDLAFQFGKIFLAVTGLFILFAFGWALDALLPQDSRVLVLPGNNDRGTVMTELELYQAEQDKANFMASRSLMIKANQDQLKNQLMTGTLGLDSNEATLLVESGKAYGEVKAKHKIWLRQGLEVLARRYEQRAAMLKAESQGDEQDAEQAKIVDDDSKLERLEGVYGKLVDAMVTGSGRSLDHSSWLNEMIVRDNDVVGEERIQDGKEVKDDKDAVLKAIDLAGTLSLVRAVHGKGVFEAFIEAKFRCMHQSISALAEFDLGRLKKIWYGMLLDVCWLTRFHSVVAGLMLLAGLIVWSIFGGAICRITAVQFASDEKMGAFGALEYSLRKFWDFFMSPLIVLGVLLLGILLIFVPNLLAGIPNFEFLSALLFPLAIIGSVLIGIVFIDFIGGSILFFPTIAVEGAGSFEAITRSFSYLCNKPWWMLFYVIVEAVYGAICYLFVRGFAYVVLLACYVSVGMAMNVDGLAFYSLEGKFSAMWAVPGFLDFHPGTNWALLDMSETLGAGIVWGWVSLVSLIVMGFLVSYFFVANTVIYFLLRQKEDSTSFDDVYHEHTIDELIEEENRQIKESQIERGTVEAAPVEEDEASTDENVIGPETLTSDGGEESVGDSDEKPKQD